MSPDSTDIDVESDIKFGDTANFKDDINEDQCEDVESELKSDTETCNGVNITLKNGTTIKQRKSFRVIRYVRFNKKKKFVIVNVCCSILE